MGSQRDSPTRPALGAGRDRPLPLSFDQERMWLFDQQLPASTSYDDPIMARLAGPLRLAAFDAALGRVSARHESLRTRFPLHGGLPSQVVDPYAPTRVQLVDLSQLGPHDREVQLARLAEAAVARPFDLQHGPVFRTTVIRLAEDEHVLIIAIHHLAADLWSTTIVVDELSRSYEASHVGRPADLPPVTTQPADLAVRGRSRLTQRRRSALRAHWANRLTGVRAVEVPADHERPTRPNFGVHLYRTQLDLHLSDALREFSRDEGATLFVTLLAGFHAMLTNWTGGTDLLVRSVFAGRRTPDTEKVVGLLTQCLVLRLDASGDPSMRELVSWTRDAVLDALDGVELPFADIVAMADPDRMEPSPLRQFGLSVHNVPRVAPVLPGLTLSGLAQQPPRLGRGVSEADVWVEVFDAGQGPLVLHLKLDDALFTPSTAVRRARSLVLLLSGIVSQPWRRLSELDSDDPGLSKARSTGGGTHQRLVSVTPETLRRVARIVAAVLGLPDVGHAANFFRLGGTSMDAVRLIARLRDEFGSQIRLADVMAAPTVEAIAAAAEGMP